MLIILTLELGMCRLVNSPDIRYLLSGRITGYWGRIMAIYLFEK